MSGGTSAEIWRCTGGLLCSVLRMAPAALSTLDQNHLGAGSRRGCSAWLVMFLTCHSGSFGTSLDKRHQHCASWLCGC